MTRYHVLTAGGAPAHVRIPMSAKRRSQAMRTAERLVVFGQPLRHRLGVIGTAQMIKAEEAKLRPYYTSGLIYFCIEGTDRSVPLDTILAEAAQEISGIVEAVPPAPEVVPEPEPEAAPEVVPEPEPEALEEEPEPEALEEEPPVSEDRDELINAITIELTMAQLKGVCQLVDPVVRAGSSKAVTVGRIRQALYDGADLDLAGLEELLG